MAERRISYVPIFFDDLDAMSPLSDAECGRLIKALLKYGKTGEASELSGNERFLYPIFKAKIDRSFTEYEKKCEQNRQNVKKRWNKSDTTVYDGIQSNTNGYEVIRNIPKEKNRKEKNIIKKENILKEKYDRTDKSAQRFVTPTPEEVKKYCEERGNSVDAERFVDFYTAKNWHIGRNKMKDWKAAVRTWERNEKNKADGCGNEKDAQPKKEMTIDEWFGA